MAPVEFHRADRAVNWPYGVYPHLEPVIPRMNWNRLQNSNVGRKLAHTIEGCRPLLHQPAIERSMNHLMDRRMIVTLSNLLDREDARSARRRAACRRGLLPAQHGPTVDGKGANGPALGVGGTVGIAAGKPATRVQRPRSRERG